MVAITEQTLLDLTSRLVTELQPERIYLFGSRAVGMERAGSDIDLLVVVRKNGVRRKDVARAARKLTRRLPCGVDVVVRFHDEFEERSVWPTTLECAIKTKGRLLYG